ncbi:MAG: hypothetical protein HZC41_13825 [Chloroflexi bacterium]|nr:hypothetical protein [Chloroflexota bacterium]
MTAIHANVITDVSPWPHGKGFSGGSTWWQHVLSQDERQRLDHLMGVALLDTDICKRLLGGKDDSLFSAFGLSEETRQQLRSVQATTLVDLARAITCGAGD